MKLFIASLLSLFLLVQCDVIDELTQFDIDTSTHFTIPSTSIINTPFDIFTPDVTTNSSSEFSNNDTRSDLVESIKLKSLKLVLNSPEDGNFNFLKSVQIYIDAEGLDEVEIANAFDLEDNGDTQIELNTTGEELKEFIKKDSYSLRIKTVTDQTISEDHEIEALSVFRVDAEILGI